ncbi:hypothetical protein [Trebonia sp.]|uniref:hypothetical protein n=1 Tax=Trebonia sp. TaxID=2767075 RepID=UPI002616BA0D|nr:hypothetical protein [Trebonia sp.]
MAPQLEQEDGVLAANHGPNNVVVEAASNVVPQLTSGDTVLLRDGDADPPLYPDRVLTCTSDGEFTFPTIEDQVSRVRLLKDHGCVTVYSVGGYLVMRKPGIRR